MSIFFLLLALMVGTGCVLLGLLAWAVKNDQFEDVEGEKHRIFFED